MKKIITKIAASFAAATTLITGVVGISTNVTSSIASNTFNIHYAVGAPSSEIMISEYNYAYVPNTDPVLTATCTLATKSSNVNHCEMTVYLRTSDEGYGNFHFYGTIC